MKILALDASTDVCAVALGDGAQPSVAERAEEQAGKRPRRSAGTSRRRA